MDKKGKDLFTRDFNNANSRSLKIKSKQDGINVEIERKYNNKNESSVGSIKIDTVFKDLNGLKVEKKLNGDSSA